MAVITFAFFAIIDAIVIQQNANNTEIRANVQHWIDTINEGLRRANSLFGLSLSCKLRHFDERERGVKNDSENVE